MRLSRDLTDEQAASMTDEELAAWSEAQAVGPWEPNDAGPESTLVSIVTRMPRELLAELEAEAAAHRQPYQRYAGDLLLLALRQVQAARRRQGR